MILLVDVGNTNIVIGVYKENECIDEGILEIVKQRPAKF